MKNDEKTNRGGINYKNPKGFTLIELLAVIVILAVIALILTPIVTGIIEQSKKKAEEASALYYIDAVEKYMILHELDSEKYPYQLEQGKTYYVVKDTTFAYNNKFSLIGKIYAEEEQTNIYLSDFIQIKGETPTDGYVVIGEKNTVFEAKLRIKNYEVFCSGQNCSSKYVGRNTKVVVTYNPNGGNLDKESDKINKMETLELPIPTKENYSFEGWFTEENGKGDHITNSTIITENITLYAHWSLPISNIDSSEYTTYMGSSVKYNGDSDWSILYIGDEFSTDGIHMYLISKTARWSGKPTANGNYNNTVLMQPSGANLLAWSKKYSSSNSNSNGASKTWSMLTASNYSTYCDSDVADWAIGGATVDLYFKAYNMKNGTSIGYNSNYNSYGYSYSIATNLNNSFNLNTGQIWFASPGSYGNGWVMILAGNKSWCHADKDGDSSFHPVVSIKTTAKIYKDGDDYIIIN